jgi:HEPN domain-containing protein
MVKSWFRKANQDLRLAKLVFATQPDLLETGVFHCQQAAEKAMKGFLSFHKVRLEKTHDLRILIELIASVDAKAAGALAGADKLTKFATAYRYPDAMEERLTAEMVNEALLIASRVYDEMSSRIPLDAIL